MEDAEADGAAGGSFGFPVGVSHDRRSVGLGAPEAITGTNTLQGSAYVFAKPAAGFGQEK